MQRHSPVSHAAYHDLLRPLPDEAVAGMRGTPTRVTRNGKTYWYGSYRVGTDVRKRYIGEDSDVLQARIDRHQAFKDETEAGKKDRLQGAFLIDALAEDRPEDLAQAWKDARQNGPNWRERLDRSLEAVPEIRSRLLACL